MGQTVTIWAERSKRDVAYALCNDRRTLLWFANQRAIEYHPTLARADSHGFVQTHLVLDLDPPAESGFGAVARVAELVRRALADAGLTGAVKTSGAKGLHVFVPVAQPASGEEIAAATGRWPRARAHRPAAGDDRLRRRGAGRQGVHRCDTCRRRDRNRRLQPARSADTPVSFPVSWDEVDRVTPRDFNDPQVPAYSAATRGPSALPSPSRCPPI